MFNHSLHCIITVVRPMQTAVTGSSNRRSSSPQTPYTLPCNSPRPRRHTASPASRTRTSAPAGSRQPYLRRVRNRRPFRDMNMNRLIIFICPEINSISAYGKNVRQFEYLPKQHICRASAHLTSRASRKTPFLHH